MTRRRANSKAGSVMKKSLNRYSAFVKFGAEDFMLGNTKREVPITSSDSIRVIADPTPGYIARVSVNVTSPPLTAAAKPVLSITYAFVWLMLH